MAPCFSGTTIEFFNSLSCHLRHLVFFFPEADQVQIAINTMLLSKSLGKHHEYSTYPIESLCKIWCAIPTSYGWVLPLHKRCLILERLCHKLWKIRNMFHFLILIQLYLVYVNKIIAEFSEYLDFNFVIHTFIL